MTYYNYVTSITVIATKRCGKAHFIFIRGRRYGKGIWVNSMWLIYHNFHTAGFWRNHFKTLK